jgi:hypothetical protein
MSISNSRNFDKFLKANLDLKTNYGAVVQYFKGFLDLRSADIDKEHDRFINLEMGLPPWMAVYTLTQPGNCTHVNDVRGKMRPGECHRCDKQKCLVCGDRKHGAFTKMRSGGYDCKKVSYWPSYSSPIF